MFRFGRLSLDAFWGKFSLSGRGSRYWASVLILNYISDEYSIFERLDSRSNIDLDLLDPSLLDQNMLLLHVFIYNYCQFQVFASTVLRRHPGQFGMQIHHVTSLLVSRFVCLKPYAHLTLWELILFSWDLPSWNNIRIAVTTADDTKSKQSSLVWRNSCHLNMARLIKIRSGLTEYSCRQFWDK